MYTPRESNQNVLFLFISLVAVVGSMASRSEAQSPVGTAFTYQGLLEKPAGTLVDDTCDFTFRLLDASLLGNEVGASPVGPIPIAVVDGIFVASPDFGIDAITGKARWLEIVVQCPGDVSGITLSPRIELKPVPYALSLPNFRTRESSLGGGTLSIIGGSETNTVSPGLRGAAIVGGGSSALPNSIPDTAGIADLYAFIGGGLGNTASGAHSTVAGGKENQATEGNASVGGGFSNHANGQGATVAGGIDNTAGGGSSVTGTSIGGGEGNTTNGSYSTIGGGYFNDTGMSHSTVAGGDTNLAGGLAAFVGGGVQNFATGSSSTIAGGSMNTATGLAATIGGGQSNGVSDESGTIGGGEANEIDFEYGTIGGGLSNTITNASAATIGGGEGNLIHTGDWATIAGGNSNSIGTTGANSVICGGFDNSIIAVAATIAGGESNAAVGLSSTIGGGFDNAATGYGATVPGGVQNVAGGTTSFAAGGLANANHSGTFVWNSSGISFGSTASGQFLINAPGNVGIGTNSPSAKLHVDTPGGGGIHLSSNNLGDLRISFNNGGGTHYIFDDQSDSNSLAIETGLGNDFVINTNGANNRMRITSAGLIGMARTPTTNRLEVEGNASKTTSGSWLANSDACIKEDVRTIKDALSVIDRLRPVAFRYTEEYKSQHPYVEDQDYYNFIAQEFAEVFPEAVSEDGSGILQMDSHPASIYAVAAIQELHSIVKDKERAIDNLRTQNDAELQEVRERDRAKDRKINELVRTNAELVKSNVALEARLARIEQLLVEVSNSGGK